MKTIFRVAKTELYTLFYSPIAWFLMIVFLVQCSLVYIGQLGDAARMQELGGMYASSLNTLTLRVFLSPQGLFGSIMQNLFLYIPLLTMSLISRETSSGTIKLLYSSPVAITEIVLGKYLAMMMYSLLLVAIIALFIVSGMFHIQHPDTGVLCTALLAFFLLLCAYSAIGLFMSSLTNYQVVAAICTFVTIGVLSYIGTLWQDIAFVRSLTYFLSINGRTQKMLAGLITSKDLVYFIVIVFLFLSFTVFKLRNGIESVTMPVKAGRYLAVTAIGLLAGYLFSLPGMIAYYDASAGEAKTLTPNAQKIIQELKEAPLEVTAYNNLLGKYWWFGRPESYNENLARWEPYMRFKPDIRLKNINYYDTAYDNPYAFRGYEGKSIKDIAIQYAKSHDASFEDLLSPDQIRQQIDLKPELNRYVMQLKWKNRSTWLRVFDDQQMWPGETEVSAAFKRLLQARLPKVAFVTGNLERDIAKMGDRDYKAIANLSTFRYSLVNQGFDVDTLNLNNRDIPDDVAILVIADLKLQPQPHAIARLQKYIQDGGNLLIAGEPGKQALINPLLQSLGVQLMNGMLIQESKEQSPVLITPDLTKAVAAFTNDLAEKHKDSIPVSMPGAAAISVNTASGFAVQPLLLTSDAHTWNRLKPLDLDMATSASINNPNQSAGQMIVLAEDGSNPSAPKDRNAGTVHFSAADGDARGAMPVAVALSRKLGNKQQRIVVTGDADFMSNAELQRSSMRTANFYFTTALFSWLNEGQFPIETARPEPLDKGVNLTLKQVGFLKIIYVWIIPALLLAVAAVLLIRRKRK